MSTEFTDKVVIITGATGNLGRAVVSRFDAAAARLVLVDLRREACEELASTLSGPSSRYMPENADLGDPDEVEKLVERIEKNWGRIDVLAHTVGGFAMGDPVHAGKLDVWDRMMALNARSLYITCGRVARHMVDHEVQGRIIAILARAGLKGAANMGAYTASKAAAQRIIESMAQELRDHHITVNGIMPSIIDTPINRRDMPNADFSKWVKPEQIAATIHFLASEAASAITGESVGVYGRV